MSQHFKCLSKNKKFTFSLDAMCCPFSDKYYNDFIVEYDYGKVKINKNASTICKQFKDLLPNQDFKISFGEKETPLIRLSNLQKKYGFEELYLKDESYNPTQSFKDRGNFVFINCAIENKIRDIFVVSSGNDAISTAAYAQKAKINCSCIVSKNHSNTKMDLIKLYGGSLVAKNKTYEQIYRESINKPPKGINATSGFNPLKEEGIKMIGFELWKELGVPDVIVAPCGNGTLLYAIYKAYWELRKLKYIESLPKLIGIQIKGAAPLKAAFEQKKQFVTLGKIPDSIAGSIIASESYSAPKLMSALTETNGSILEVTDDDIIRAVKDIIKEESIIPELSSASVFAALAQLPHLKNKKIALILTAGGIKELNKIKSLLESVRDA